MSRLNHSCRPNAEICSDSDVSKPLNIRAMSKIEAGEEIVISYKFALVSMNSKVATLVTRHDDLSIGDKCQITESSSEGFS